MNTWLELKRKHGEATWPRSAAARDELRRRLASQGDFSPAPSSAPGGRQIADGEARGAGTRPGRSAPGGEKAAKELARAAAKGSRPARISRRPAFLKSNCVPLAEPGPAGRLPAASSSSRPMSARRRCRSAASASSGELARVMLALKADPGRRTWMRCRSSSSTTRWTPTSAARSGRVVGEKMAAIGRRSSGALHVTHLHALGGGAERPATSW